MKPDPQADLRFARWARQHYQCVVSNSECCKLKTFALLTHSPVPAKGSGVVLCRIHALANNAASLESVGREEFEVLYGVDLVAIATRMQQCHDGEMLFEGPPEGLVCV